MKIEKADAERIGKKIANVILKTTGLVLLNIAAYHFGGIYGVLAVEGLIFRGAL